MQHIKHLSEEEMEAEVVTSEVIAYLSQAVEVLPEEYAAVLRMYIEGYSPAEISERAFFKYAGFVFIFFIEFLHVLGRKSGCSSIYSTETIGKI